MDGGAGFLEWFTELARSGAKSLPVDRDTFAALVADDRLRWDPYKPTLGMFDKAREGQQVAHIDGVPMVKLADD